MQQDHLALRELEPFISLSTEELHSELYRQSAKQAFRNFVKSLQKGQLRAAYRDEQGNWHPTPKVKQGILFGFRLGVIAADCTGQLPFYDKDTLFVQSFSLPRQIRIVPGGTAVRCGAFIGSHVTIMPPAYVNIGAFVDEGTLIDSHALVGSCAQVGKRVHLSAAAQLGGVLEPIGALPVVIEDDVFIGGNVGIYEGVWVRARAVVGAGVVLTSTTPVYDLPMQKMWFASAEGVLSIPEGAVVVSGGRKAKGSFAQDHGLSVAAAIIVKYRDGKTDSKTTLEKALRENVSL